MTNAIEPDYKVAARELKAYFETLGLEVTRSKPKFSQENPSKLDDRKRWNHFAYTFTFKKDCGVVTTPYYCGADDKESDKWFNGIRLAKPHDSKIPQAHEVLSHWCQDALDAHENKFEDWANMFGYNTDSRKAEKVYRETEDMYFELRKILSATDIEKLAEFTSRL